MSTSTTALHPMHVCFIPCISVSSITCRAQPCTIHQQSVCLLHIAVWLTCTASGIVSHYDSLQAPHIYCPNYVQLLRILHYTQHSLLAHAMAAQHHSGKPRARQSSPSITQSPRRPASTTCQLPWASCPTARARDSASSPRHHPQTPR